MAQEASFINKIFQNSLIAFIREASIEIPTDRNKQQIENIINTCFTESRPLFFYESLELSAPPQEEPKPAVHPKQ